MAFKIFSPTLCFVSITGVLFSFLKIPFHAFPFDLIVYFLLLYFPVIYALKVVLMVVQKLKYISLIVKVEYKSLLLFIPFQSNNFKTQIHLPLFICYIIIYSIYVYVKPNKLYSSSHAWKELLEFPLTWECY